MSFSSVNALIGRPPWNGVEAESATERASDRSADFGIDTTAQTTGEAIRAYLTRLRGGDLGGLPALLGLLVLFILFTALASDTFPSLLNLANLLQQGAGQTIIAMGLVFVLLTGEIDLAAGTASGLTAAVMALHLVSNGNLLGAMGTLVFVLVAFGLAVTVVLGALLRIWSATALAALALLLLVIGFPPNPWLEMLLAVCTGVAIGIFTGFLVSRVGMPSFVATLALFIAWYGVIEQLVGQGGELSIRQSPVLFAVTNGNLTVLGSWLLFVVFGGGYSVVVLFRHFSRLRQGLVAQPTTVVVVKSLAVLVVGAAATFLFTLNRSPNPDLTTIRGVPYVVPIILVLLAVGTFVLDRTRYGRYLYAIGGNAEAARRSGVNVTLVKWAAFCTCSVLAVIAGVFTVSRSGLADATLGRDIVLSGVAAAVVGGVSLFGGRGRLVHAVVGAFVIAVINNGLLLIHLPAGATLAASGAVLIIAATVDALSRRRAGVAG